jgi:uncharacterized protein YbjT (DUF2867 family)
MRVLVTGANGFIGAHVCAALREAGHEVVAGVRKPRARDVEQGKAVPCDFARDVDADTWKSRLDGVDAVVNCIGILRETHADRFQRVHVDGPLALFKACSSSAVRRVIQVSALGAPEDGEFIASKHRGDMALMQLDLDWLVLRPGLVYSVHGAYGGTSLLRALSVLPGVLFVPRDGTQPLRPIAMSDLALAVTAGIADPSRGRKIVELVGPELVTLRDYLLAWRRWFGLQEPVVIHVPAALADLGVGLGEFWGRGPLCRVIANLLQRGRVGAVDALEKTRALIGREPTRLTDALQQRPCQLADFMAARWFTLEYLLFFVLAAVWIASGIVGLSLHESTALTVFPGWAPQTTRVVALASSVADFVLGLALLTGRATQRVLQAMLVMLLVYTLVIGSAAPLHWLDPFGGLLKNLPIAATLSALLLMAPRRR